MAVVALDHAYAGSHLDRKSMNIHSIIEQCKSRVGMTETVKSAVLARARASHQASVVKKHPKGLTEVIGD